MQNRAKYFLDVNIVIDLLVKKEYENVRKFGNSTPDKTKQLIEKLLQNERNICLISSVSLVTAFFAMTNKNKNLMSQTADLIMDIYNNDEAFMVISEDKETQLQALQYVKDTNTDYEDILQYFCAKKNGCIQIITNDKYFPKLDIPIKRTNSTLEDYIPTA